VEEGGGGGVCAEGIKYCEGGGCAVS
jgi:hypothetical protein